MKPVPLRGLKESGKLFVGVPTHFTVRDTGGFFPADLLDTRAAKPVCTLAANMVRIIGHKLTGRKETMIREELSRLFTVEERHRRLLARLLLAFGVTIVVFAAGTVLTWALESGQKGGDIHGFGDAAFFTAVQLLTVSSQIRNPLTSAGRIVDVGLELWAVFVVTVVAGSFATFFSSGDSS